MRRKWHGDLCKGPIKEEGRGNLSGEEDKFKFIDLRFERKQVIGSGKGGRRQDVPLIARSLE